ncbi:MAG TPA: hypothetical protein VLG92_05185 [Candidatus Saccharimonadia bacterium]|nr:hypothetical protein [Candidatus Saccharimonadia bacterium]
MADVLHNTYPVNDPDNGVEARNLYDYSGGEQARFVAREVTHHPVSRGTGAAMQIAEVVLREPNLEQGE